jgi:pyruvate dehydrogenase E2 component (dihydrolipoamide acetyltransferase)
VRKLDAAAARPALQSETMKMSQMQLAIARAMDASLKSTAQTTISMDLDAGAMVAAYRAHKDEYSRKGIKLSYTAILVKIVAEALVEHRLLRTIIEGSNLVTRGEIHIGIAIDVDDGLVVPNIKNSSQKSIAKISAELADLGKRAKDNTLSLDDITGGVFTITNLGMFGIKYFAPILNPGESGILGVGTIQEVAVVQQGGIFMKPVLNLSLTHDHRVVNGAPAARFLQSIQSIMNDCERLFQQ